MRASSRTPPSGLHVARAPRPCGFIIALALIAGAGCTSQGGTLKLEPRDSDRTLTQNFASAYITQSRGGEFEIVLVDHARHVRQSPKEPLKPQPLSPTRQVMHLHLYWKPLTNTTRNPAAVNAAIDWYVLGSDAAQDVVLYEGAGVVTISGSGKRRRVVITDGSVRPRESRGAMHDPIGNSRISGFFIADLNAARVREILAEMRETETPPQASSR